MRTPIGLLLLAAVTAIGTAPASATITYYSDRALFTAALAGTTTEDFTDTALAPGFSFTSDTGYVDTATGNFHDRPIAGGASTTFAFAGGANGYGADFDLTPGGFGQGLKFTVNYVGGGSEALTQTLSTNAGSFFGFTSTQKFGSVLIQGNDPSAGSAETYTQDNVAFGTSAVPEPATWAMMIGGFGMVGASLRPPPRGTCGVHRRLSRRAHRRR